MRSEAISALCCCVLFCKFLAKHARASQKAAPQASWAAAMDIGGKYSGTLSGAMNSWGNLGGAVAPTVIGITGSYGKSSSKAILAHMLQFQSPTLAAIDRTLDETIDEDEAAEAAAAAK